MGSHRTHAHGRRTGRASVNITIDTTNGISVDSLFVHDNDGLRDEDGEPNAALGGTGEAGAIVISSNDGGTTGGVVISKQVTTDPLLTLDIDSDAGTGDDGAFLNIAASIAATNIHIGSIGVGKSGEKGTDALKDAADVTRGATGVNEILTGLDLSLGGISANVQLGATPQGAMIKVDSTLEGGLNIENLGINDAAGGGQIYLDGVYVRGANATGDIAIDTDISVTGNGLLITNNSTEKQNVYIAGVHLGSQGAASIGDVEVQGLHTGGSTITISGH